MTTRSEYQALAVSQLLAAIKARKNPCLVMPTGTGKTETAIGFIRQLPSRLSIGVTAHRRSLVNQFDARFGKEAPSNVRVHTIGEMLAVTARRPLDVLVVDEAHRMEAAQYRELATRAKLVVGLTATPSRLDGKSLMAKHGGTFDCLVVPATNMEWLECGAMVEPEYYTHEFMGIVGGYLDAATGEVTEEGRKIMAQFLEKESQPSVQSMVSAILSHTEDTDVGFGFSYRVAEAKQACDLFNAWKRSSRAPAVYVSGKDEDESGISATTEEALEGHLEGMRKGLVSCIFSARKLIEGIDVPQASYVAMGWRTGSLVEYRQMAGRAQRAAPGKNSFKILDPGGNKFVHGHLLNEMDWETHNKPVVAVEYKGREQDRAAGVRNANKEREHTEVLTELDLDRQAHRHQVRQHTRVMIDKATGQEHWLWVWSGEGDVPFMVRPRWYPKKGKSLISPRAVLRELYPALVGERDSIASDKWETSCDFPTCVHPGCATRKKTSHAVRKAV